MIVSVGYRNFATNLQCRLHCVKYHWVSSANSICQTTAFFTRDRCGFHPAATQIHKNEIIDEIKYPIEFSVRGIKSASNLRRWLDSGSSRTATRQGRWYHLEPECQSVFIHKNMTRERLVLTAPAPLPVRTCTLLWSSRSGRLFWRRHSDDRLKRRTSRIKSQFSYADFTLTTAVGIETNRLNHSYIKSPITDGGWKVSVPFKFSDDVAPNSTIQLEAEKRRFI
jgi:hypothetical protein